jgi:dihydropteroate synthase
MESIRSLTEVKGLIRGDPYFELDASLFQLMQDRLPDWADHVEAAWRLQFDKSPNHVWTPQGLEVRPALMGILNVTPDSFSDGGRFLTPGDALQGAMSMLEQGADMIDVGGESSRPFSEPVSMEEEVRRVIPVITGLRSITNLPISIDTMKKGVARKALEAGASMINDISGLRDPEMASLAAEFDVPVVIMHMRGTPKDMQSQVRYDDVVREVVDELNLSAVAAMQQGVKRDRIILDPGIGFGKTARDNLEIINRLREFRCLGYPILLGASRKSFIGKTLGTNEHSRLEGSLAVASMAMCNGADIIRVHDVLETLRTLRMMVAMQNLTI